MPWTTTSSSLSPQPSSSSPTKCWMRWKWGSLCLSSVVASKLRVSRLGICFSRGIWMISLLMERRWSMRWSRKLITQFSRVWREGLSLGVFCWGCCLRRNGGCSWRRNRGKCWGVWSRGRRFSWGLLTKGSRKWKRENQLKKTFLGITSNNTFRKRTNNRIKLIWNRLSKILIHFWSLVQILHQFWREPVFIVWQSTQPGTNKSNRSPPQYPKPPLSSR